MLQSEIFGDVSGENEVDVSVPVGGSSEVLVRSSMERLHDLTVAARLVLAHAVTVEHVDCAALAGNNQEMRVWARLVRKQEGAPRAQVLVILVQVLLVEGREVVTHEQLVSGEIELEHTVAVVPPTRTDIKSAVTRGEENAALLVCCGTSVPRPNSAIVCIG